MTSLADRTIAALRSLHDDLGALVPTLSEAQLTGRSGSSEWHVAQVLSHLGSGAEIGLATNVAALAGEPGPEQDFNQSVWDRWNAMSPQEQASGFLTYDERLVQSFEALTSEQRENFGIKLGFMPAPLPVAAVAGMRLNEAALHGWDVRVALDPTAVVADETALVLADHFVGNLSFLLGFIGKADALAEPAVVDVHGFGLVIGDGVSFSPTAENATATFVGPLEAVVRLFGGRLTPDHTPDSVGVVGNVSLDDLRRVFPGY
jgi:uncharacterized protein (TIGR03083 family)